MWSDYLKAIWIIFPVALISAALESVRLVGAPKVGNASPFGTLVGFFIGSMAFGFLAIFAYNWISARWPQNPQLTYFLVAAIIAAVLTVMAIGMHFILKSTWRDVITWTAINLVFVVGYGWFLPRVLSSGN